MAKSKIAKDKIPEFLKAVSADYAVLAPQTRDGIIAFGPVESADTVMLDYRNSTISAKELFLPRAEVVYEFDGESYVDNPLPDDKRVVFGMRPCDCRALALLDMNFDTEQIKDPFYVTRRENTVVLGLACSQPLQSCFCTATGGDPFGTDGADVLMADVGESLLIEAVTEKGEDFLAQYGKFFSSGGSAGWDEQAKEAKGKVDSDLDLKGINASLNERFENEVWEVVSRKCLGCGACSYLCPSCYCFDLVDEKAGKGVKKVRAWDCCMFSLFTHHASGHNPRPVNSARLRQKLMHKFSYYPERYGVNGCVGCGRCVRSCPVSLDIREVLGNVKAVSPVAAGE
jgi:ferredoxin